MTCISNFLIRPINFMLDVFNAVAIRTAPVRRPHFAIRTGVRISPSIYGIVGGCAHTSCTRFRVR